MCDAMLQFMRLPLGRRRNSASAATQHMAGMILKRCNTMPRVQISCILELARPCCFESPRSIGAIFDKDSLSCVHSVTLASLHCPSESWASVCRHAVTQSPVEFANRPDLTPVCMASVRPMHMQSGGYGLPFV